MLTRQTPGRVDLEQSFVLHRRPYRETSLLVEAFSADFGRLGLVAKGARRPKSRWGGLLQPFSPLLLSWRGKDADLMTLIDVEAPGPVALLPGRALKSGFYLNELLLRLLPRQDPHPALFQVYQETLMGLKNHPPDEPALRIFEKHLLATMGYGLLLDRDAETEQPLEPDKSYWYRPEYGPVRCPHPGEESIPVHGYTLLALLAERLEDPQALREAKYLMRSMLRRHLGEQPLWSRTLFKSWGGLPEPSGS